MHPYLFHVFFAVIASGCTSGCASAAPTKASSGSPYSAKTSVAGLFGDVGAVAGDPNIQGVRSGGAAIIFLRAAKARNLVVRLDKGVSTVTA